jgi:pimeloyl-ACP methyl ester carboxylesterase
MSKTKIRHKILYISGLGDHAPQTRKRLGLFWHYKHVDFEVFPMRWGVDELWAIKLDRLLKQIDTYTAKGYTVSLIGESAGASAAINALRKRTKMLRAVVLLCGKSQYPNRVASRLYTKNPSLRNSLADSHHIAQNLTSDEKHKILNIHPIADEVVPVWETKIPGVKNVRIPSVGHAPSILLGATLYNLIIVRFIKRVY